MKTSELSNQGAKKSVENKSSYYGDTNSSPWERGSTNGFKMGSYIIIIEVPNYYYFESH
jgi:hypothetical protein